MDGSTELFVVPFYSPVCFLHAQSLALSGKITFSPPSSLPLPLSYLVTPCLVYIPCLSSCAPDTSHVFSTFLRACCSMYF
jgi:hypothetical protein